MSHQQRLCKAASQGVRWQLYIVLMLTALVAACAAPRPHKVAASVGNITCGVESSITDERCFTLTPEVSKSPAYTMHVVEFDDQGWLYPGRKDSGYDPDMGLAHEQLDRAVKDVASRLANNERVLLLTYVHGWKHSAAYDDRDLQRFRQMLANASVLDAEHGKRSARNEKKRSVVGIYVGWRGAGRMSPRNPLINLTFWTRKNAALHVSQGAPRELFARIGALRKRWNTNDEDRPRLRSVVMGHSFGGWVVFSALAPSLLELFAQTIDAVPSNDPAAAQHAWRRERLKSAADMVILVNPAFEATRYQPVHDLAQRAGHNLSEYDPPTLLIRQLENAGREKRRHEEWNDFLRSNNQALPQAWTWQYCGGTTISKNKLPQSVNSPVWNVITGGSVIANHSDIMGEALHSFIRQLYLDLPQ